MFYQDVFPNNIFKENMLFPNKYLLSDIITLIKRKKMKMYQKQQKQMDKK